MDEKLSDELWTSYRWLSLVDAAEALGMEVKRLRALVREDSLLCANPPEGGPQHLPTAFITDGEGNYTLLDYLPGTITLLLDGGFSRLEALSWLLSFDDSLGDSPIQALARGRKHEVRRVAAAAAL